MSKLLFLPVLFLALFSGCTKLDPKIEAASYIEIDDYTVITDSVLQGTSNQKFYNVLVTSRTQNYGYYPLPAKIPLPLEGEVYLSIRPAIKVNGISFLKLDYPVMKGCDTTLTLKRGESHKLIPVFKYYSSVAFPVVEDFEKNTGFVIANKDATDTFCATIDTANAAFGQKCLHLKIDGNHQVVQVQSTSGFPLPSGASTFLEINYKSSIQFEAGVILSSSPGTPLPGTDQRSSGGANPSDSWKKLYIDLSTVVRTPPYAPYYFLYFYTATGFSGAGDIYIDNIKLVHQ